ncbi:ABC transporter substrate-binding protein [Sphingobacterium shayense]|nr:ABC transporter substrate-binding protein [Sphingobacterium shayense]
MNKIFWGLCTACLLISCQNKADQNKVEYDGNDSLRIVSLNGTVSEIVSALGLQEQIVGTDVASNYPSELEKKPKVGHSKKIPVEGVLALRPNLIVGTKQDVNQETVEQFKQAGVRLILFDQEYTVDGAKNLIRNIADTLHQTVKGDSILKEFNKQMLAVQAFDKTTKKPRVLFIYARGAGTMMVGGKGTQVDKVIELAGAENAAKDFDEYKPLTPEALVAYNPDVLLFFSSGLSSLGEEQGLLQVQGVTETNAGKNRRIIAMDGQLLSGFSPRLPQAIEELHSKIN